ncbi:MAG: M20/M25/M40 family metallo-hydrolase, partial [Phycisphaerales bacterium]|nr:M20/M25/M40 family metallo-hydrolase [Phycisphaerales bacterium]
GLPIMHVTPAFANRMLAAGGLQDIKTLQDRIERTQAPASAPLEGVSARGRVEIEPVYSDVRNVVGMIPGTGPQKDEIIVLGAHYDHLGIRNKDKADFDPTKDISNGADDNASGTAMLMQFAKAYTQGDAPNRTLVLVAFTGEELGLLGSAHFAKEPTVDLDKCIAMLNFDMVGRLKDDMLEVGGMRTGGFEAIIDDLAQPYGFDIRDGGGGRGPSDHT